MNVYVSDLAVHSFCPRKIYLSRVLKIEEEKTPALVKGALGHEIRKKLCLRQAEILRSLEDTEDILPALSAALDGILAETKEKEHLPEIRKEILAELKKTAETLEAMLDELGLEEAIRYVTPWKVEYRASSEKLGLSGRIDKVMNEREIYPVEIKTGESPHAAWDGDRLQVCAYAMLLEEVLGIKKPIRYGYVEYTSACSRRPVMNDPNLRQKVLETRDAVRVILEGRVPDVCEHGLGQRCESCSYMERCYEI